MPDDAYHNCVDGLLKKHSKGTPMTPTPDQPKRGAPKCGHCQKPANRLYTCPRCEDLCCNECCAGVNTVCFACEESENDDE